MLKVGKNDTSNAARRDIAPPRNMQALEEAKQSAHPLARCLPRGDRVVIKRDGVKDRTGGGVILPDSVKNRKRQTGTVIRVGPGLRSPSGEFLPMDLAPGDTVIITGYAGLELRDDSFSPEDEEYVMLREEDVQAFLPPE